jgi:hypothetical protein
VLAVPWCCSALASLYSCTGAALIWYICFPLLGLPWHCTDPAWRLASICRARRLLYILSDFLLALCWLCSCYGSAPVLCWCSAAAGFALPPRGLYSTSCSLLALRCLCAYAGFSLLLYMICSGVLLVLDWRCFGFMLACSSLALCWRCPCAVSSLVLYMTSDVSLAVLLCCAGCIYFMA